MLPLLILSALLPFVAPGEVIDLSHATMISTTDPRSAGAEGPVRKIADGDPGTVWSSGQVSLEELPANIVITWEQPVTVGSLEVLTNRLKGWLRLTWLEVYAGVGDGWALLGEVRDNRDERFVVELVPTTLTRLRLRLRGTERPDQSYANLCEIGLRAGDPAQARPARQAAVADQGISEQIALDTLLGKLDDLFPEAVYEPAVGYLGYVQRFVETMMASGTDRYGTVQSPMFCSLLDLRTKTHPGGLLVPIAGQRVQDRANYGGNLQHDIPLLQAMEGLSALTGDARYRQAARDYLAFFLDHCTATPTGLWPWGEHTHWDFFTEAVGQTNHEHLGLAPLSFYKLAYQLNPQAVIREADGCINHVVNLETFDFNRHADVFTVLPDPRPDNLPWLDFSRHGGFYIFEWAFAWSKSGDAKYLGWIDKMLDHFENHRQPTGIRMATPERNVTAWSLSLTTTLAETAPLLGDTPTGQRMARLAREYFAAQAEQTEPDKARQRLAERGAGFSLGYGGFGEFKPVNLWLLAWRQTGDPRCLANARPTAEAYRDVATLPTEREIRADVFGQLIEMFLDFHEIEPDAAWLAAAERYAQHAIRLLWVDGLFRGASGLWYYDSELFVSSLVHALTRLGAVLEDRADQVPPSYFHR